MHWDTGEYAGIKKGAGPNLPPSTREDYGHGKEGYPRRSMGTALITCPFFSRVEDVSESNALNILRQQS